MVYDRTENGVAGASGPGEGCAETPLRSPTDQPSPRTSQARPAATPGHDSSLPTAAQQTSGGANGRSRLRRHMGVATSDPSYLPEIETGTYERTVISERIPRQQVDYGKYLSQPRPGGRQIFTSPQERRRRRTHRAIIFILVAAMVVAAIWFFVLR